ncbi:hypothetical protein II941_00205 [bacterium]|nr:hypothetical protein [bacterium]
MQTERLSESIVRVIVSINGTYHAVTSGSAATAKLFVAASEVREIITLVIKSPKLPVLKMSDKQFDKSYKIPAPAGTSKQSVVVLRASCTLLFMFFTAS